MPRSLRGFALALGCVWAVLLIAAYLYSQDQDIPRHIAFAVVPAFLLEAGLYIAAGSESVRERLERLRPATLAAWMTALGPAPYVVYSAATGMFQWADFAGILAIAATAAFWYVLLPRKTLVDLAYLGVLAGLVIAKVFAGLYPRPLPRLEVEVLGVAMLVRTGMVAVLSLRRLEGIGFGFLPQRRDWLVGLRYYVLFLPAGLAIAFATGFLRGELRPLSLRTLLLALGTFLGMLWVVALSEEFFFRGILQQSLGRLLRQEWAGWAAASLLFGAAHLPFREFPNYRFALLATVAGAFYGLAYRKARSIRAAMVTHALVNTTWRVFLS